MLRDTYGQALYICIYNCTVILKKVYSHLYTFSYFFRRRATTFW